MSGLWVHPRSREESPPQGDVPWPPLHLLMGPLLKNLVLEQLAEAEQLGLYGLVTTQAPPRPPCPKPCTANEGPVRIQYKCLVPIYVLPEMNLLFPKQNYNVLSPSSYAHISMRDLYISRIGLPPLPILLQEICGLILGIYKALTDT